MGAAAVAHDLASIKPGKELAFIGLPSKRSGKQLSGSVEELIRNVGSILDDLIASAIEKHNAADFRALWDEVFPNYARVMLSLSRIVSSIVPHSILVRINAESLSEMEANFRDHALSAFGPIIQDQAVFTVWTLRKIADLAEKISAAGTLEPALQKKDEEFCSLFTYHVLRSRFHLDCLAASMRSNRAIYPEVLEVISDGLRSAVDAYAWIKQGADLRVTPEETALEPIKMDEEDQEFLEASAHDMATESD